MEHLAGNLVSEKDRTHSVHQMIAGVPSPVLQCELINRLHTDNKELFSKVRASTVVATDLRFLPSRVKSLLIQSIDADTFGTALSDFAVSFDALLDGLPQTYQSVFADAQSRHYEVGVVNAAWKRILSTLNELVAAGLISKNEVGAMIRRADLPISVSSASEASENDEGEGLSAA